MAIGSKSEFAAPKVALDIAVCTKFCRCISLNFMKAPIGILETISEINTPIIAVFGVTPKDVMICRPMIAPKNERSTFIVSTPGSRALGCFSCTVCTLIYCLLNHKK